MKIRTVLSISAILSAVSCGAGSKFDPNGGYSTHIGDNTGEGTVSETVHGELKADGNSSNTYALIGNAGYICDETPDLCGVHTSTKHITQSYDATLSRYVFDFHIHIDEDDDRGHTDITDRQRNEIKTDSKSPADMRAKDNETLRMSWYFKLPLGMKTTSSFCHVHQLKGIGSDSSVSTPLITLSCRSKNGGQVFQVIGREEPSSSSNEYLCNDINLQEFLGEWIKAVETATFSTNGEYKLVLTRVRDGKVLVNLTTTRNFVRSTHPGYRPKWGIYRSFGANGSMKPQLRDETVQFADFKIEKL